MSIASVHLDRLLEPLADCLTPGVAAKVADLRADDVIQERIDYLAERANDGLLTGKESEEYTGYLQAIYLITVLQAKARSILGRKL